MSQPLFQQIGEHELLEPSMGEQLLEELVTEDNGLFSVQGSLRDYRIDSFGRVVTIKRTGDQFNYEIEFEWPDNFDDDKVELEQRRVRDTLLRAGVAQPRNLSNAMAKLRRVDDVIIGIDTNILLDCNFTAYLLDEISYERFPDWILIAVPKLVMAEIENQANEKIKGGDHPRTGWPSYKGRLGNRGLQELMALDSKDVDHPGLSLMTVGNLDQHATEIVKKSNWLLDSEIRKQFHEFLSEINFHKGTYFLSEDRVNAMMSRTEGAEGLYLQKPELEDFKADTVSREKLYRLFYELGVQFGELKLSEFGGSDIELRLSVFWPGKHVSDWRRSRLRIETIEAPPW